VNTDFHLSQKLDAVHSLGCWQSVQSLAPMGQPDKAVQAQPVQFSVSEESSRRQRISTKASRRDQPFRWAGYRHS